MGCICLRAARGALLLALVVCLCFPARAAVWVEGMELDIELPSGKTIQDNPGGSRIDVGGAQYTCSTAALSCSLPSRPRWKAPTAITIFC